MLSPPVAVRLGPMMFAVLGQGLSTGLAFAALGVALYAKGPALPAAALFGAAGVLCGVVGAALRLLREGVPPPMPVPLPAEALAGLLRSTLAEAQRQRRATRVGTPADRRPDAAQEAANPVAGTHKAQAAVAAGRVATPPGRSAAPADARTDTRAVSAAEV